METSQYGCSVTLTFPAARLSRRYRELLQCEVTDSYSREVFPFSPQSSGEKPGVTTMTTAAATTTTTKKRKKTRTNSTGTAINDTPTTPGSVWWLYVIASVGFVALVIIIVVIIRWKRSKGNKAQMDDKTGYSLNPAVTECGPETSQDAADPEDGVSYASISYTKQSTKKAWVQVANDDDDEGDAVTYSSVKASSSSAGASDDPDSVYAVVSKPNKIRDDNT
ncbi:uncharacterized protein [Pempheris klunzingeri]|uniref:uncharacterized protein n=1 Tax=Pempheris klunzingeri TaxID=3127111 RepID=UPI00397EE9B1